MRRATERSQINAGQNAEKPGSAPAGHAMAHTAKEASSSFSGFIREFPSFSRFRLVSAV
jgi:hypothetical protein